MGSREREQEAVALLGMKDVERTIDDIFAKIFIPPIAEKPAPLPGTKYVVGQVVPRGSLPIQGGKSKTAGRISYI